jgi:hypothetical protein
LCLVFESLQVLSPLVTPGSRLTVL